MEHDRCDIIDLVVSSECRRLSTSSEHRTPSQESSGLTDGISVRLINGHLLSIKMTDKHVLVVLPCPIIFYLSTIKDWDQLHLRHFGVVFERLLCSAGITNENEFQFSGSPTPRVSNDVTLATPTHSLRQYGFFSEPPRRRQMPKGGNLKRSESLLFAGDIESLEPSKF